MADKKEVKLTNWKVPRSPEGQFRDALTQAPSFDQKNYENIAPVHHGDLQAAIDRTIAKQEAARGMPIDQVAEKEPVNLKGVNDERPKEFWTPPRIGKR